MVLFFNCNSIEVQKGRKRGQFWRRWNLNENRVESRFFCTIENCIWDILNIFCEFSFWQCFQLVCLRSVKEIAVSKRHWQVISRPDSRIYLKSEKHAERNEEWQTDTAGGSSSATWLKLQLPKTGLGNPYLKNIWILPSRSGLCPLKS